MADSECERLKVLTPLNDEQREKLINFKGYGNPAAPFWFIGMEEGSGGQGEKLCENILARLRFSSDVMDLQVAHDEQHLCWRYWDENERVRFPSVWIYMARFVRAMEKQTEGWRDTEDWWNVAEAKTYVRDKLGRANGETFLTEFLPLPKRNIGDWPKLYTELFKFDQKHYWKEVLIDRQAMLSKLILDAERLPHYILCYGGKYHMYYKELFAYASLEWQACGLFEIATIKDTKTRIILSPFMGNGRLGYNQMKLLIDELRKA